MTGFDEDGFTLTDTPKPGFAVLNDSPVGEGGNEDLLESTVTAGNLAELILASRGAAPFTVAIDAGWGMGKSSLLRRLDAALAKDHAVSTVWFNAWTSERADAVEGLIKSVLLSFDRNVLRRVVRGTLRKTHVVGAAKALSLLASSFFGIGQVVDAMWRALAVNAKSRNEIKAVVRDMAKAWLAKGGQATGQRLLVVFVDDLDRCSDERIFEVCETIKLYLDVPGIVFVLACDQAVLWRAVGHDRAGEGVRYLEKIIQVSYPIPAPSPALVRNLVNGYVRQSGTAHLFDESMKTLLIERTDRNPRRIKRLINSFVVEHRLGRTGDELSAENLVKIILLRHFYPEFYTMIIHTSEGDMATRFLDYQDFRESVRQGAEPDPVARERLFTATGVRPPAANASKAEVSQSLEEVTKELPVNFPELARDKEFVALFRSIPPNALRLPQPLVEDSYPDFPLGDQSRRTDTFAGLRVLWIDDVPDGNRHLIEEFRLRGARVDTATNREEAIALLPRLRPNALISDIQRYDDSHAGFTDLRYLRDQHLYDGPAFFYTGHVTPARLSQAKTLGADGVTNNPTDLLTWLGELPT
ncbi:P-loop NTPase fold protein [Amycolatopsis pithecellobii]|uniref:Response regulator n=1 Tax=Amycolatopsis pithecellobii TaxID=664692 RepID=A0A6N7YKX7_9PSEU|nr:P-loop NTPase fold protein [Amycolatopsis pithecellobii]MTD53575.1 response regulator [Amycolatopsis pithecellobii]